VPERVQLPESLSAGPFSHADARAAGIGRGRLRNDDLLRPFHGVRAVASGDRIAEYAPRLRSGDRFSHTSAARLWGAPVPRDRGEVHVTAGPGRNRPRVVGAIGHRSSDDASVLRHGLPTSTAVTTFLECARVLALNDLVAIGDHLVLDPRVLDPRDLRPHVSHAELLAAVRRASGRAVARARAAAALVRQGVESPRETRLRLLLLRAGLPEPVCGYPLVARDGSHIGWFDLAWPEQRVIAEYDGDQHRTSTEQYDRDITRFDRATEAGWRVVRVRARGLSGSPSHTVERVRRALQR
jgi:hypothetical protein